MENHPLVEEFTRKNKTFLNEKSLRNGDYDFTLIHLKIIQKHFNIINDYCRSKLITPPEFLFVKFKFGIWTFTPRFKMINGVQVLVDDLCRELEAINGKWTK